MITCPACQNASPDGARFCPHCGGALPATAAPAPAVAPPTSGLAITAFVLSFIPFLCLFLVGAILGLVALNQINARPQELGGRKLAIAAVAIGFSWVALAVIGILAAIAIPNFIRYSARAKQAEPKTNLRLLHTQLRAYEAAHDGADPMNFDDLGFSPEPTRRYAYFFGDAQLQPAQGGPYAIPAEVEAKAVKAEALAVSNLDEDDALDVWMVDKTGELTHLADDLAE